MVVWEPEAETPRTERSAPHRAQAEEQIRTLIARLFHNEPPRARRVWCDLRPREVATAAEPSDPAREPALAR